MKKWLLMGLFGFGVVANAEPASTFHYNYVEGQYVAMGNDNLDLNPAKRSDKANVDGLRILGSIDIAQGFGIVGSIMDTGGNDYDLTVIAVGADYHQPLPAIHGMPLDLIVKAEIEHVRSKFDVPPVFWWVDDHFNDTGIVFTGGAQMQVIEHLQVFSNLAIGSNDRYRTKSLNVGARYEFVPSLEASAALEVGDMTQFSTGIRYSF